MRAALGGLALASGVGCASRANNIEHAHASAASDLRKRKLGIALLGLGDFNLEIDKTPGEEGLRDIRVVNAIIEAAQRNTSVTL